MAKFKDKVVVAVESFCAEVKGKEVFIRRGAKLYATDDVVAQCAPYFADASSVDGEVNERRAALLDPMIAADVETDRRYRAEQARREGPPIPFSEQVVATVSFTVGRRQIREGVIYGRDDPVVAAHPEYFATPARPLNA